MNKPDDYVVINRLQPSLQHAIRNWMRRHLPVTSLRLEDGHGGVLMPSTYLTTLQEVAMHMASAAMPVLELHCALTGLKEPRPKEHVPIEDNRRWIVYATHTEGPPKFTSAYSNQEAADSVRDVLNRLAEPGQTWHSVAVQFYG